MKKRIVALGLCIMMLTVSLSSCGVMLGGFGVPNVFDVSGVIDNFTAVMYSENHSINVGMMAYYYNTVKNSMSLSSLGGFSSATNKVVTSGNDDGEIKYYVSTDIVDIGDNVIIYDKVTDFEISEGDMSGNIVINGNEFQISDGAFSGNIVINGNDFVIGALGGEIIMNSALEQAREILVYCEIADMHGINLSIEEEQQVEEDVRQYIEYMSMVSNMTDNTSGLEGFVASILDEVLTDEKDTYKAAAYARLAEKVESWLYENAEAGVSSYDIEERYERQEHFEGDDENTRDFHFVFIKDKELAHKIVSNFKAYGKMNSELFIDITRDLANTEVSYVYRDNSIWYNE